MADIVAVEAATGERCGKGGAPSVINFVKSLFVGANDSRTLERHTAVTAVVSRAQSFVLAANSCNYKRALSEDGLTFTEGVEHCVAAWIERGCRVSVRQPPHALLAFRPPFHPSSSSAVDRTTRRSCGRRTVGSSRAVRAGTRKCVIINAA